jgi:hypothetical protein
MENQNSSQCCPEFNVDKWNEKEIIWNDKLFIKGNVISFFHMPLNMGNVITKMWNKIEKAEAGPSIDEFLLLCYDPSAFKTEVYMTVTKEVPGEESVKISGTFYTKVFDGPYQKVPEFIKEMEAYVALKEKSIKKIYIQYAYCPKCSKKYGHNYMILFAEV